MQRKESEMLQVYLRDKFKSDVIRVVERPKKDDSMEVYVGDEFMGVIFRDDDEGEISYSFNMAIFTFNFFKNRNDSLVDDKQRSKLEKIVFEKLFKTFHLLNVFLVILPLTRTIGMFFFLRLKIMFGHISESIKKALEGFQ